MLSIENLLQEKKKKLILSKENSFILLDIFCHYTIDVYGIISTII